MCAAEDTGMKENAPPSYENGFTLISNPHTPFRFGCLSPTRPRRGRVPSERVPVPNEREQVPKGRGRVPKKRGRVPNGKFTVMGGTTRRLYALT